MIRTSLLFAVLLLAPILGMGQDCPSEGSKGEPADSAPQTLEGKLIFHDGLRRWFELVLDNPRCGQKSIQVIRVTKRDWVPVQVLRGCRVRSVGPIGEALTGYYSLDLYQDVQLIEPIGGCSRHAPFPDDSTAKPDARVLRYKVTMDINFQGAEPAVVMHVTDGGRELRPWNAYAGYYLTGG